MLCKHQSIFGLITFFEGDLLKLFVSSIGSGNRYGNRSMERGGGRGSSHHRDRGDRGHSPPLASSESDSRTEGRTSRGEQYQPSRYRREGEDQKKNIPRLRNKQRGGGGGGGGEQQERNPPPVSPCYHGDTSPRVFVLRVNKARWGDKPGNEAVACMYASGWYLGSWNFSQIKSWVRLVPTAKILIMFMSIK